MVRYITPAPAQQQPGPGLIGGDRRRVKLMD